MSRPSSFPRRALAALAFAVVAIVPTSLPAIADGVRAAASDPADPADPAGTAELRRQREELKQQKADLAAQIDTLQANESQVKEALAALDANVVEQEALLDRARRATDQALVELARARLEESKAADELAGLESRLRTLAVQAYVSPPQDDWLSFITNTGSQDAIYRQTFAELQGDQLVGLLDDAKASRQDLRAARDRAEQASEDAATFTQETEERLAKVTDARAQQAGVLDDLEANYEDSLAEAEAVATLDQQLADEIQAKEAELARRLAEERRKAAEAKARAEKEAAARAAAKKEADRKAAEKAAADKAKKSSSGGSSSGSSGGSKSGGSSSGGSSSGGSSGGSSGTRSGAVSPDGPIDVVTVRGITVNAKIADNVKRLLADAADDGIILRGGGYRDASAQVETRRNNCGTTDYDIWEKPASACTPPTARPGHSMHERGLAIDFTYQGVVIQSHDNAGYRWLAKNAARYGLYNLPVEPWHWSTNGN